MAATNFHDGPQPIAEGIAEQASAAKVAAYSDLAIALVLSRWHALTVAVSNQWGGADSAEKRDWLAGVISDLFQDRPETDQQDVEDVLLQVMADEFDLQLEDESEIQTAAEIMRLRTRCLSGDFAEVEEMRKKWEEKGARDVQGARVLVQSNDDDDDDDDDDGNDDGEQGGVSLDDGDVEMGDAPPAPKPRQEPEVDDDGFTTVRRKR